MDEQFLDGCVAWLREMEPSAVAVVLMGSYARGEAGPFSDLDLEVLTEGSVRVPYRSRLVELANGRLIHITAGAYEWRKWMAGREEPADWAFGFPVREAARLLWASDEMREELRDPTVLRPPAPLELQDFVECLCKVWNAWRGSDELALRFAAQDLAERCPSLLRLLNPEARVGTPYQALRAALDLPVAPPGYPEDFLTCLGLGSRATTAAEIHERATRLGEGILTLLQEHASLIEGAIETEVSLYLTDGTLQRFLAQDGAEGAKSQI
jgi:phosphoribosyl-AMP cyclohydrolase